MHTQNRKKNPWGQRYRKIQPLIPSPYAATARKLVTDISENFLETTNYGRLSARLVWRWLGTFPVCVGEIDGEKYEGLFPVRGWWSKYDRPILCSPQKWNVGDWVAISIGRCTEKQKMSTWRMEYIRSVIDWKYFFNYIKLSGTLSDS